MVDMLIQVVRRSLKILRGRQSIRQILIQMRLDKFYRSNQYDRYLELFHANEEWVFKNRLSKYFSWAAIITKGHQDSLGYMESAVSVNPIAINDISTAIVADEFPDREEFYERLKIAAFSSDYFKPIVLTYAFIISNQSSELQKVLQIEEVKNLYSLDDLLETHSLLRNYEKVIEIYQQGKEVRLYSLKALEIIYDSYTNLGMYEEALGIFDIADKYFNAIRPCLNNEINPHAINNKLERQFWFKLGDMHKAYLTYRRQRLAQMLKNVFKQKYVQDLEKIGKSRSPLVLASWGPGDEIRFSKVYPQLYMINRNVTISCEPRLSSVFEELYPWMKFQSVHRTRRVDQGNSKRYSGLPVKNLHHVLDNDAYKDIIDDKFDCFCLLTDILADLAFKCHTSCCPSAVNNFETGGKDRSKKEKVTPITTKRLRIGISWRSSIQTASRKEHYFEIEHLAPLFSIPNAAFVNLQYGECDQEISQIRLKFGVDIEQPDIDQFNDLGSVLQLMKSLDYIVSAGTTVLELAGLSSTPTFFLTNSPALTHRCNKEMQDIWFPTVRYVEKFEIFTKLEIVKKITAEICNENNIETG